MIVVCASLQLMMKLLILLPLLLFCCCSLCRSKDCDTKTTALFTDSMRNVLNFPFKNQTLLTFLIQQLLLCIFACRLLLQQPMWPLFVATSTTAFAVVTAVSGSPSNWTCCCEIYQINQLTSSCDAATLLQTELLHTANSPAAILLLLLLCCRSSIVVDGFRRRTCSQNRMYWPPSFRAQEHLHQESEIE